GILRIQIDGTGTASHLGKYASHAVECFNPVTGAVDGEFTQTAANGDTLFGAFSGPGPCGAEGCHETSIIQGGTGRFAGAEGLLHVTVIITGPDTYTEIAVGTVSSPGAASPYSAERPP